MKKHVSSYLEFLNEDLEHSSSQKTDLLNALLSKIGETLEKQLDSYYEEFEISFDYATVKDGLLSVGISQSLTDSLALVGDDGDIIRVYQDYTFKIRLTKKESDYSSRSISKEEAEAEVVVPDNFSDLLELMDLGIISFGSVANLCNIDYLHIDMDMEITSKNAFGWAHKDGAFGEVEITPNILTTNDLVTELITEMEYCQNAIMYREEDLQSELNDFLGIRDEDDNYHDEDYDEDEDDEADEDDESDEA